MKRHGNRITAEVEQKIIDMWKNTEMTNTAIAKLCGVNPAVLTTIANREFAADERKARALKNRRSSRKQETPEPIKQMVRDLSDSGMSIYRISCRLNLSYARTRWVVNRHKGGLGATEPAPPVDGHCAACSQRIFTTHQAAIDAIGEHVNFAQVVDIGGYCVGCADM